MDPLSITAGALAVLGAIGKTAKFIEELRKGVESVDGEVESLFGELESLHFMIESINHLFQDESFIREVQIYYERSPTPTFSSLHRCLENCLPTVHQLGELIKEVAPGHRDGVFRRAIRHFKLEDRQEEIMRLRQQLQTHQASMNVCLSVVHM